MSYNEDTQLKDPSFTEGMLDGVRVEIASPAGGAVQRANPIIYRHGGGQGSWAYAKFLPFFA